MARPKVLLTRRWPRLVEQSLMARHQVSLNPTDQPLTRSAMMDAMRHYDALCPTVTDVIDAEILATPEATVRIMGNYGAGTEHIDLRAAKHAGIVVTNTPDVLTDATADLAMLLILMSTRRAGEGERQLRAQNWTGWHPTHLLGHSIAGKLLGFIGFGRIARATARRAQAFGMRIAYHSRSRATPEIERAIHAEYVDSIEALLTDSDIVSLHVPGGPQTHHLIDAKRLASMKPSAVLINTSRGSVVDEAALAAALECRAIAAAGLDVFQCEPRVNPALLRLENVVLLPHLGSATEETRIAMGMRVVENLDLFFSGRPPRDPVQP